jgi:hypothetical protein
MDQLAGVAIHEFVDRVRRLGADAERLIESLARAVDPATAFQAPGDIVLTRGRRLLSHLNALVQSVIEGRPARATHAMIVAAPGYYVDVSIRFGVSLLPAPLFAIDGVGGHFAADAQPLWRRRLVAAFRHPELARSPERHRELFKAIAAQLGQPYNRRFLLKRAHAEDGSAFCSELVARTFARLGLSIVPGRRHAAVLPQTLYRHLRDSGWQDVSAAYRSGLPMLPAPAAA